MMGTLCLSVAASPLQPANLPHWIRYGTSLLRSYDPTSHTTYLNILPMRNRNKYNPRLAVHPLGQFTQPRIDVLHGDKDLRMEAGYCEAVEIARQQLATLNRDFGVLFINLTAAQSQIERDHVYACNARHADAGQFKHVTYRAGEFASKLGILTQAVVQKKLATIVICGLEFGFQSSRHKKLVVDWLKDLKDHFGRQVIVYSLHQPGNQGLDKTLVQLSDSVNRVGDYSQGESLEILPDTITGVEVEDAEPIPERVELGKARLSDQESVAAPDGSASLATPVGGTALAEVSEMLDEVQVETLKNKELSGVDV